MCKMIIWLTNEKFCAKWFIFYTSSVLQSNDDSQMFIIVLNNLYQMCCRSLKKKSICHYWVIELDGKDTTWM